jgi:hypothetical protein
MKSSQTTPLVRKTSSASVFGHAVILVLFPWLLFVGTVAAFFWLLPMGQDGSLGMFLVAGCCLAEFFIAIFLAMSRRNWVSILGWLVFFAVVAGAAAGLFNEYAYSAYYHKYVALNEYSNVLPTAPVTSVLDAGVLHFSSSSFLDTQRSTAFMSFTSPGITFCVAPVLDATFTSTDEVGIWAVGMNCCGKRASFYCDDADKGSTSAVVLLPAKEVLPEWITNLGVANNHYADYMAAIKLASASFGVSLANEIRFVHWKADTQAFVDAFYYQGLQFFFDASAGGFVLLFVGVVLLILSGNKL